MKKVLKYFKYLALGFVGVLAAIILVNQIPTSLKPEVQEATKAYQTSVDADETSKLPLYQFLHAQKEFSPENVAEYGRLIEVTALPDLPPKLEVHITLMRLYSWNREFLNSLESKSEAEKLKSASAIIDLTTKLLNGRVTHGDSMVFMGVLRSTADWVAEQKWSAKSQSGTIELQKKIAAFLDRREQVLQNALRGERDVQLFVAQTMKLSEMELNGEKMDWKVRFVNQYGEYFFDRNQTQNLIYDRLTAMGQSASCLKDYNCSVLCKDNNACGGDSYKEINYWSMIRNPVGKGLLQLLSIRFDGFKAAEKNFKKLEESNKKLLALQKRS